MKRRRSQEEKPALDLIEEAFHLVRRGPPVALAAYCLGTLPFILALLFFWSDMAHSAFAGERLALGTLGLTALFVWMKTWQAVCARHWLAHLSGELPPRWKLRWLIRTGVHQTIIQPFGLFLLPISLVLFAPFAWTYGFFANVTVFSGSTIPNLRALLRKSWRQVALWPMQNHLALFTLKLFGLFVFLNLLTAVFAAPFLMKSLLGLETVFAQSPWAALNSTLLATLAALTFLCLDPILKATYTLRCFYGESLRTGADLRAELKNLAPPGRFAAAALLFIALQLVLAPAARSQNADPASGAESRNSTPETRTSVTPPALDHAIQEIIKQREYSWRLPRDAAPAKKKDANLNWLERMFKSIEDGMKSFGRWIGDAIESLMKQFRPPPGPQLGGFNPAAALRSLLFVLIVVLAALLVWLLVRIWRRRRPAVEVVAQSVAAAPDVADENVGAEQLPEDGWMKLARELLERGELRLAVRAFYLATLAHLAERNLLTLAKFKSNRDYERELSRRGHALAELPGLFGQNVSVFECVWYGLHDVNQDTVADFARNVERMKSPA